MHTITGLGRSSGRAGVGEAQLQRGSEHTPASAEKSEEKSTQMNEQEVTRLRRALEAATSKMEAVQRQNEHLKARPAISGAP